MNKEIKEIVLLLTRAKQLNKLDDVQKLSNFYAVIFALITVNRITSADINELNVNNFRTHISKSGFNEMLKDYRLILDEINEEITKKIITHTNTIIENNGVNSLSWIYEYIKCSLNSQIQKRKHQNSGKIEGDQYLISTQFFTDEYMIRFLLDETINKFEGNLINVTFVDPACGGGNFLSYAFDKLFSFYKSNVNLSTTDIINKIFQNHLIGYDIDSHIADIAKLSLLLKAKNISLDYSSEPNVFSDTTFNYLGYLSSDSKTSNIDREIAKAKEHGMQIVFITNPPFMGGRDMNKSLKFHLEQHFPASNGDMCVAFLSKMLYSLDDKDFIAAVLQNSWLYLSSYRQFRINFLNEYHLDTCVDLGSGAFAALNGEKANVVLAIIRRQSPNFIGKTTFYNLRYLTYENKNKCLSTKKCPVFITDCAEFQKNIDYAFNYELNSIFNATKYLPYGKFAHCMQGSSTGNSKSCVKYFWEVPNNNSWSLVSKGGGHCKWVGLNYYKVLWGENGELLKKNPGCALRNLSEIPTTELVYSDTGTMGLNVRIKRSDQVFIASGPGIKIKEGDYFCHAAFLNSKFASYWLKISNPKLTISAGYISKIPVTRALLSDKELSSLSHQCYELKYKLISSKLPNFEFAHPRYSEINNVEDYITETIIRDLDIYKRLIDIESRINSIIYKSLHLSKYAILSIEEFSGKVSESNNKFCIEDFDSIFSSLIGENCIMVGKRLPYYEIGSDNILEHLCIYFNISPTFLFSFCKKEISKLKKTRSMYYMDFLHKLFLKAADINSLINSEKRKVSANRIKKRMIEICPNIPENYINIQEIERIHNIIFKQSPIVII